MWTSRSVWHYLFSSQYQYTKPVSQPDGLSDGRTPHRHQRTCSLAACTARRGFSAALRYLSSPVMLEMAENSNTLVPISANTVDPDPPSGCTSGRLTVLPIMPGSTVEGGGEETCRWRGKHARCAAHQAPVGTGLQAERVPRAASQHKPRVCAAHHSQQARLLAVGLRCPCSPGPPDFGAPVGAESKAGSRRSARS